jgi:hypothetical protein
VTEREALDAATDGPAAEARGRQRPATDGSARMAAGGAPPGAPVRGGRPRVPALLALQRQAGNAAVTALVRGDDDGPTVQREVDGGQQSAINAQAGQVAERAERAADERDPDEPVPPIDPGAKAAARAEQRGAFAQPDKVSGQRAQVEQAASETKSQAAAPAEPVAPVSSGAPPTPPAAAVQPAAVAGQSADAAGRVQEAVAGASRLTEPPLPEPVTAPPTVDPLDSTGAPLPIDPAGDIAAGLVATRIAHLRHGAHLLAVDAVSNQGRAQALRAGITRAQGKIDEAEGSIGTVRGHVAHRRTVVEQAGSALETSQQKAATVAAEAPGVAAKADEGQADSSPMAAEATDLASTASGAQPDDAEAAAKSQEQSGQISQVSGSLGSIDSAIGQTGQRAQGLQEEAAQAQADNATSAATIDGASSTLDETDARLDELDGQNQAARGQVEALSGRPDEIDTGAAAQAADAAAAIASSQAQEARLRTTQESFRSDLAGLPGPSPRRRGGGGGGAVVQRQAEPGARERFPSLDALAQEISNDVPTERERAEGSARLDKRRHDELAEINAAAGGDFSRLDTGQRAGLALRLTFSRSFSSLGETNWPKFGLDMLRGFVDPRVSMAGIVSGLGMILSGGANLLSAEQWERDPLGNLLKSAADIATGVTVVLGSIAGLAVAIIAISAALILVSFGTLSPIFLPVISICSTVAATVGPWALTAAKVALVLNAMVFIKNLIDAATAKNATELLSESEAMGEDVSAMGNMAMQIAGDKIGEAVGPHVTGVVDGVQGRLASSGTMAGTALASSMDDIGAAMARGQARADAWAGRDVPTAAGAAGESAATGGDTAAPAPEAAPAPTVEPAATGGGAAADTGPAPAVDSGGGGGAPETAPAPTVEPATGGAAPEPAGGGAAPETAPAPTTEPAGGGAAPETAPAPTTEPAAGGAAPETAPAPTTEPAGGGAAPETAPAPTTEPAAGGAAPETAPAPTTEPAGGAEPAPAGPELQDVPEAAGATPANDNATQPSPEANEAVLEATGTDDVGPAPSTDGQGPTSTEPGGGGDGSGGGPDELDQLIADQAADMATDPGLTDVEPGGDWPENPMDLPEYEGGVAQASEAFERLPGARGKKTVGGTAGGESPTESGYVDSPGYEGKAEAGDRVDVEGREAGHETEPHVFDPKDTPGGYENSHAERQKAVSSPGEPLAASRLLCPGCQRWFGARARMMEAPQFVADPSGVHVFMPDGRHWVQPHPSGAVVHHPGGG